MQKKGIGLLGETYAVEHLWRRGFKIIGRNFRTPRWGELDIIAQEGEVLVFVEVKTRSSLKYGTPAEAVNFYKKRALKRAVDYYLLAHQAAHIPCRLDLITIILEPTTSEVKKLEHFRNVPF